MPLTAAQVIRQVRDDATFLVDRHGRIASWSEGVRATLGWDESDWLGQPVRVAFTPEDVAAGVPEAELVRAAEIGRADGERWMLDHSGKRFFAIGAVTRLVGGDNCLVGFLHVLRDFTAHKLAQAEREKLLSAAQAARAEAQRQAATLAAAMDAIPDGISLAKADGVITHQNTPALTMLGLPSGQHWPRGMDEMVHKFRLRHQRDGPLMNPKDMPFARALDGEVAVAEFWATRVDGGKDLFIRSIAAPIVVDGRALGAVSVNTDLTQLLLDMLRIERGQVRLDETGAAAPVTPMRVDGVTVLVIDDEPDMRETTAHLLRDAGARVLSASNAIDGLAMLQQHRPHVLLSDIGMPGNDGYELMRWVRALPDAQVRHTPAAAFTAYGGTEERRQARLAGYQRYLVKPAHPNELVAAVAELAHVRQAPWDSEGR